jgi:hypothetical protein
MPAIITTAMRVTSAQTFLQFCQNTANNLYSFISRTLPWAIEASPPTPIDCRKELSQTLHEMIAAKKVSITDLSLVAPRFNWTSGVTYTQYSDSINLFDPLLSPFYVVNSVLDVFLCINNANNSPSTSPPAGFGTGSVLYGDLYTWKYMFSIGLSDALKFITSDWIPVKTLTLNDGSNQWAVQQAAIPGTLDSINISAGGSQYTTLPTVTITGDGSGASAAPIINSGSVVGITVNNSGLGYSFAKVAISGGGTFASGAVATAVISSASGHGADPVSELGAYTTMIAATLTTTEGGAFTVLNDYRRIGLIQSPLLPDNISPATQLDYDLAAVLNLTGVTGSFVADEQINGITSLASAIVLDWTSATGVIRLVQPLKSFTPGETLSGATSGATGVLQTLSATTVSATATSMVLPGSASGVDSIYNNQTVTITGGVGVGQSRSIATYTGGTKTLTVLVAFSPIPTSSSTFVISNITPPQLSLTAGTILYLENRTPIMRASDQTEQIRYLISQ